MGWRELIRDHGCAVAAGPVSAVELTAALLRIAGETIAITRAQHGDPELSDALDRLTRACCDLLGRAIGGVPVEYVASTSVDALIEVLEHAGVSEGIAALTAARCVDAYAGGAFVDAFRARSMQTVRAGDAIPVVRFPSDRLSLEAHERILEALGRRTSDPRNRTEHFDRTDHLRLAPAEIDRLRVRIVWAEPWLDPVTEATRFGVAVTNDAAIDRDFAWREYTVGTRDLFYGVGPRDPDEQHRRLQHVLAGAEAAAASIVVLPELCLTEPLLDRLEAEGAFDMLPIVVAGSYHAEAAEPDPGANVAVVFAGGMRVAEHRKFTDFHFGPTAGRRHEHLDRDPARCGFDLLLGPHGSIVVLICKDALDEHVARLVQDLAPTVVLVPSMGEEVATFELLAARLARDPQAFTVVAIAGPGQHGVFGRPSRKIPVTTVKKAAPNVAIFRISGIQSTDNS